MDYSDASEDNESYENVESKGSLKASEVAMNDDKSSRIKQQPTTAIDDEDIFHETDFDDSDYTPSEDFHLDQMHNSLQISAQELENNISESNSVQISDALPTTSKKLNKVNKNLGKEYYNSRNIKVPAKKFERLSYCKKKCYSKISLDEQKQIFRTYWKLGDYNKRRLFISQMIDIKNKKTATLVKALRPRNRQYVYIYHCEIKGQRIPVCHKCFLKIYGETQQVVKTVNKYKIKQTSGGLITDDRRGKHDPAHKLSIDKYNEVIDHISSIPKYESHYTRRHTSQLYFDRGLNLATLYRLYTEKFSDCVSISKYRDIFTTLDIKFKQPQLDLCNKCELFKSKIKNSDDEVETNLLKLQQKNHHEDADFSYESKQKDKDLAKSSNENIKMFTFDLQQCLPTPYLRASMFFYKRPLWTFNLTVHDGANKKALCYVWNETIAKRGANDIGSCIFKCLLDLPNSVRQVILYSDSCPGQNRNSYLCAMFEKVLEDHASIQLIDHKFLVVGHTHLECDTVHAQIEKKKKNFFGSIEHSHDWANLISATNKNYIVHELRQEDFFDFRALLKDKYTWRSHSISGISSLSSCGDPDRLPELPPGDEQRLQRAALHLQQKLILREWLKEHRLQHHYSRLIAIEVASLEDVYWLEDSRASKLLGKDWQNWSQARQKLPTSKSQLDSLKAQLWSTVVKSSQHQDAWTWGGMLVVSVSVAGLVTLAAMTQPSLAPEARHSLLQYVTGKYLLPANCKVHWDWTDPHIVGGTMCFMVRFFQRNGQPYPICDTDQFFVEVTEGTRKVVTISELGSSTDPNNANIAKVKFTVRTAGVYKISVLIGSSHIAGSPFTKTFIPGTMDARRSRFIRPASTVVCCAGTPTLLHIEPRDEFGNACVFGPDDDPAKGYKVDIFDLHDNVVEKLTRAITLAYDKVNSRVAVTALFPEPICLRAVISYLSNKLPNGDFDIIVLSSSDTTLVHKNIASRKHNICYEAKLLSIFGQPKSKPRKVLCYVGPKQVTIKEMILKFIPKRIATFRLCPSTKFHFLPHSALQVHGPVFIIDDGSQPKIELASKDRNIIAATFTHFLLKNIGGSETFKDKQDFFYHEVRKFHSNYYHEKLALRVQREKILESSMKSTKGFSISDWCGNFEVTFQGEQGIDWGGLRREWFELICSALFDPRSGLFCTFHDKRQALVHPNPNRSPSLKLKHFEFAGKIVGKCLYESALGGSYRQLVRARFTRSFLAQLIGLRVHYKYFEQDDPDLYLSKIKYILDTDLDASESLELYFVEEIYDISGQLQKTVELIPNGSKVRVTNSTKNQYLDALAQQRLCNSVKDEVDSFLKGLNGIIPDNLLSIFDENELELLMCGTGEYSIADFRAHHVVNGNSAEFRRVLGWFWAAVSNFSRTEMARLLQFTTGCSQLPPGGFQELNPRFQLTAAPTFGNLPTAHTCFNQLCLPDYEGYEQFEKALLLAISEGSEGFGMV